MTTLLDVYNATGRRSDKEHFHHYISNFYCEKLSPRKDDKLNILEIGIFNGDSLKLWEDFFPNANIYGLDINDHSIYTYSDRVDKYIMNAYSESTINFLKSKNLTFDIIIDDGPHTIESQNYCCKNYKHLLNKNGLLVIEDVIVHNLQILQESNPEFKTLNLMHIAECFMDNIILYLEK